MGNKFTSVDQYIESFSGVTQARLQEMRALVLGVLPEAAEGISYNVPALRYNGAWVVYYSGFAKHTSFALGGRLDAVLVEFADALTPYKTSVSAIQFPYTDPLPGDLITRLVQFRCSNM
jgi:uncharacterized protein YdhG (YjbR/CyaY superfamily)